MDGSSHQGYTKDMVTDFDEKHDEYLILLQQRNRILKHLKTKDPVQLRLEHLEQGFSVYVNGANSELKTSPRKAVHSEFRSASHAEGSHDYRRRTLFREAEEALRRNSRTAPSKVQRRGWHQKSVQIRTEAGSRLHIEPPPDYSEDFEPCADVTSKAQDASGDRPQDAKSPTSTTPCDFSFSLLNARGHPDPPSSVDKERILLTIQDVMELRKSLELSVSLQRKQKDCSSDEYDSIEEDVLSESEPEDHAQEGHSRDDPSLSSGDSVQKDVSEDQETEGRPPQGPDTLVVLEFNPASKSEFAFGIHGSNSKTEAYSCSPSSVLGRYKSPFARSKGSQRLPNDPGFQMELRKSLELSVSLQRKQKDCSSDEYDSIEEDVLSESEPEDHAQEGHSRDDPSLSSGDSVQKDVSEDQETEGRPPQGPDTLVVLEFNPASKSNKRERILSAKRKDNAEVFIPSKPEPNSNSQPPAVLPDQERACSRPGSRRERPLSATRKALCEAEDREEDASAVLRAIQVENAALQRALLRRTSHQRVTSFQDAEGPPVKPWTTLLKDGEETVELLPTTPVTTTQEPPRTAGGANAINQAIDRIGLLGSRQQQKLLEVLQAIESDSAHLSGAVVPNEEQVLDPEDKWRMRAEEIKDAVYVTMEILSNWGNASWVGLTEVEFFDLNNTKLYVSPHDVDIRNTDTPGELGYLVNRNLATKKDPSLWTCPFHPPLQLFFVIRNTRRLLDFGLAKIRIWNYWTTDGDLDIGAKDVRLYVNKNLIFDGKLDKGSGEAPADRSILLDLKPEKNERTENTVGNCSEGSRDAHKTAGTDGDEALPLTCSPPAEALVEGKHSSQGNVFGEEMNSTNCTKDNLAKLEEDLRLLAAPVSMGDTPGTPPTSPPMKCPPLDEEPSLIQQLENLTGRKISELPGKTPSWLQPSPTGKGRKQGGRKPKPLWLSPEKPLDWKDRLPSDDIINEGPGETEAGNKGPRREQGRATNRNVMASERAQRVAPQVCGDDLDIFDQPANKERPASGRRSTRKDAASSSHGDDQPASREETWLPRTPPWSRRHSEQEHTLHESWNSLSAFDRSHRGRISNMEFQGDVLDEFLQQQRASRHSEPAPRKEGKPEPVRGQDCCSPETDSERDFKIPVLPYGQHLVLDIKSTWGDRHYVGLNGIEIFSAKGEPVQISNIEADPPDINVLPAYGKDPRVVTNLIDGVNRTQDDMHVWLAPFTPGKSHSITIDFLHPCQVALIRIWNYNKSRIHSFRGVKDITMLLDTQCIFEGEIAKASGTLTGAPEHFGDTILFTTDEDILEAIFCSDETFDIDAESLCGLQQGEALRRPSTADGQGEERPFTQAGLWAEDRVPELELPPSPPVPEVTTPEPGVYHGICEYPLRGQCQGRVWVLHADTLSVRRGPDQEAPEASVPELELPPSPPVPEVTTPEPGVYHGICEYPLRGQCQGRVWVLHADTLSVRRGPDQEAPEASVFENPGNAVFKPDPEPGHLSLIFITTTCPGQRYGFLPGLPGKSK
ncbi:hypothetical protein TREES_T100000427 [Tupaia chinensis]|uniref:KATNIP domain-containing protein n=1 Tax=Tupaia chinensis TaxID=246437 RepID=L9KUL7_TUPCH|nr:hypothetical protein TREES_T100000427 [Tupaia chinensis]